MTQKSTADTALEQLHQSIKGALDVAPADDVLSILTGAFVALTIELVKRGGHNTQQAIEINGGKDRNITIHAPK